MGKKQREENQMQIKEMTEEKQKQIKELTEEEKELISMTFKLVVAKTRKHAIMISIPTLLRRIKMELPFDVDMEGLKEYVMQISNYKVVTLKDKIGNDEIEIKAILLYNDIFELIESFNRRRLGASISLIDTSLDLVGDYK
jgi:hypothetical protein